MQTTQSTLIRVKNLFTSNGFLPLEREINVLSILNIYTCIIYGINLRKL